MGQTLFLAARGSGKLIFEYYLITSPRRSEVRSLGPAKTISYEARVVLCKQGLVLVCAFSLCEQQLEIVIGAHRVTEQEALDIGAIEGLQIR